MRTIRHPQGTSGEDDWRASFLRALGEADLAPLTLRGYGHDLSLFERWYGTAREKSFSPSALGPLDLVNYRQHLVTVERLKPATVNRRLEALRRLSRWAVSQGVLTVDVGREVKPVKMTPRSQPCGLREAEVHALLRVAGEWGRGLARRNYALVQVLVHTGIRVSELVQGQRGDAVIHERSGILRVHGKGRKEREVPLNASVRRALGRYLEARGKLAPNAPLFESGQGQALSVRSVQQLVRELVRRAKITRLPATVHTMRHTFALNYLRDNPGKLVELGVLLGHDSLDTTAIYTRPSQEDLAADVERSRLNVYG